MKFQEIIKLILRVLGLLEKERQIVQPDVSPIPPPAPSPITPHTGVDSSREVAFIPSDKWADYPCTKKAELIAKVRAICLEEGLGMILIQKMLATIMGESGWNPNCKNNTTFDYGLCQFNKHTYLVEYKMTPEFAIANPLECARIMARNFKTIRRTNWMAYSPTSDTFKKRLLMSDEAMASFRPKWYSYD